MAIPPAFGQEILAPQLARFSDLYPAVDVDLHITTHGIELIRDQVDVAVVVGPLEDSELISKTLISGRLLWVTSPDYAAGLDGIRHGQDITRHIQICEKRYGLARFPVHVDGQSTHIDLMHGITHVNHPLVVRQAIMAGAGVSLLPAHYCCEQLAAGSLIEVFTNIAFDQTASKLTAIYPSRSLVSPRVRVFVEFISEICRKM